MTRSPGNDTNPAGPAGEPPADPAWDDALRAAIDWGILLDDDPDDPGLRDRLHEWLAAHPLHRQAWMEATRVSGLIKQTKGISLFPATPVRVKQNLRPGRRALAAMAAAVALAWLAAPQIVMRALSDHRTGSAEQQLVTLDDGSRVRLAPASAITVDYAEGARTVELLAGEAYFDVTPDHARPFRVETDGAIITVLGTGFDIRLGEGGTEVAVHHGTVQVTDAQSRKEAPSMLTAGQWVRMGPDGAAVLGHTSPDMVGSWSDRRLTAVDRPLAEVVADLRRYYGGQILLTDAALGQRSVTGIFDTTDPIAAARLIVQPHGGTVRQITPWLMIISIS